jgi:drug/metabolite transporter (DMT)-like permease
MPHRSRARAQLVLAALLFSTGGAAIKSVDFTAMQIAGFRSGIAALALLLLLPAARRGWSWRTAVVAVGYAATLVLFVLANRLTTAANTIFLQSTAPLYLLILGPWLLKEPIHRRDFGFMLLVATGLLMFFVGVEPPVVTAPHPARGNLLAAISGVTWALTICGLRWLSIPRQPNRQPPSRQPPSRRAAEPPNAPAAESPSDGALAAVVGGNLLAFLVCLPASLPLGTHGATDWMLLLYLGVFQIALAYVFVTRALRWLPALEASILLLIEPALNPVWAWLIHGEVPGLWPVAGGALILGATVLKTWTDARPAGSRVAVGAEPPP